MMVILASRPFGSRSRTRILLALRLMEESCPRELSRLLQIPLSATQRALQGLERDGLVAARDAGRTRLFRINPRYFAAADLKRYLWSLLGPEDDLRRQVASMRKRPRRTGKPL